MPNPVAGACIGISLVIDSVGAVMKLNLIRPGAPGLNMRKRADVVYILVAVTEYVQDSNGIDRERRNLVLSRNKVGAGRSKYQVLAVIGPVQDAATGMRLDGTDVGGSDSVRGRLGILNGVRSLCARVAVNGREGIVTAGKVDVRTGYLDDLANSPGRPLNSRVSNCQGRNVRRPNSAGNV